jgi:protein-disulfide isomerase-like protein with CxxC motif
VLDGFGIQGFPTSIVVGRDGRVKMIHVGMYSPEDLEAEVTPLLVQ